MARLNIPRMTHSAFRTVLRESSLASEFVDHGLEVTTVDFVEALRYKSGAQILPEHSYVAVGRRSLTLNAGVNLKVSQPTWPRSRASPAPLWHGSSLYNSPCRVRPRQSVENCCTASDNRFLVLFTGSPAWRTVSSATRQRWSGRNTRAGWGIAQPRNRSQKLRY